MQTNFHDLGIPGGSVAFRDSTSFRGSLGLRLSTLLHMENYTIKPSIFARAWDEFKGNEGTALFNPGATVFAQDRFRGVFGDVGAQLAVLDAGAFTAFVNGDYKFKTNYRDYTATVGMSYHFR